MHIDPDDLRGRHVYRLMTSLLIPRPIAWVGSRSPAGVNNLAPFSYFMGVASRPPAVAISVARAGRDALKDTARNILETGVFTVSMVSDSLGEAMVQTSVSWPPEVSEFDAAGLRAVSATRVPAPRPAEALACMECRVLHTHDLGTTHLIVGQVLLFDLDEGILVEGREGNPLVDAAALDPLARLGGLQYARLGASFEMRAPPLPEPE